MLGSFYKHYLQKVSFEAPWWSVFLDPTFIAHRALIKCVRSFAKQLDLDGSGLWLDVGCGTKPYRDLFPVEMYIGMDVPEGGHSKQLKSYDISFDGYRFPVQSGAIDGVICTQVLEHAPSPEELLEEIARILKPNGYLIMTAPFVWQEHEAPYDFTRFSSFGIISRLNKKGFKIKEIRKTTRSIETIAQMISMYILNNLASINLRGWAGAVIALLCAPVQALGLGIQRFLPDKGELFLDSAILAYKPEI